MKINKGTLFKKYLMKELQDREILCYFISEAIAADDPDYFKIAIGDIIKACGVGDIAKKTGISRQTIYKMFSKSGNPTHKNLVSILDAFGLKLTVEAKKGKVA
ncbi:MAG: putative addiction module antidote protein [Halobacteriovoraceae bacterium]|nr:putative addiction module antidote protein [Halobacteriovoraceae bacterium]